MTLTIVYVCVDKWIIRVFKFCGSCWWQKLFNNETFSNLRHNNYHPSLTYCSTLTHCTLQGGSSWQHSGGTEATQWFQRHSSGQRHPHGRECAPHRLQNQIQTSILLCQAVPRAPQDSRLQRCPAFACGLSRERCRVCVVVVQEHPGWRECHGCWARRPWSQLVSEDRFATKYHWLWPNTRQCSTSDAQSKEHKQNAQSHQSSRR